MNENIMLKIDLKLINNVLRMKDKFKLEYLTRTL